MPLGRRHLRASSQARQQYYRHRQAKRFKILFHIHTTSLMSVKWIYNVSMRGNHGINIILPAFLVYTDYL